MYKRPMDKYKIAGYTWIEAMIKTKLISENEIINLNEFYLNDFIKDERITKMYKVK